MRIIAIETSGRYGSLAAIEADGLELTLFAEKTFVPAHGRTAQAMAPGLKGLLVQAEWAAKSIQLVAVAVGPGSFTGLRIGVTTAKTLAYAVGAEIIGINTLAVLAEQALPTSTRLWTVLDAQRQELFVAKFGGESEGHVQQTHMVETSILARSDWLAMLQPGDLVIGPPLNKISSDLPRGVTAVPEATWEPTAKALGRVAWRNYQAGQRDDLWQLVPHYYRASAAEEKASQRADHARTPHTAQSTPTGQAESPVHNGVDRRPKP